MTDEKKWWIGNLETDPLEPANPPVPPHTNLPQGGPEKREVLYERTKAKP